MATKKIEVTGLGAVSLYKRRGAKSIKLSLGQAGEIRVSLPVWAPYRLGVEFAKTKAEWILENLPIKSLLADNTRIGKAHVLHFIRSDSSRVVRTRISGNEVKVMLPKNCELHYSEAQRAAEQACLRALKLESKQLLPKRVAVLASAGGYNYRTVKIKRLKGRWGSCSHEKDIVLNCFLMQLPWELIDYVIFHELVHTKILTHGPRFWSELSIHVNDLKAARKAMKEYRPMIIAG